MGVEIECIVQHFNKVDSVNELIAFDGCDVPETVLLCKNFNTERLDHRLGFAALEKIDEGESKYVKAKFTFPSDKLPPCPLYPALGGKAGEIIECKETGVRRITKSQFEMLSLGVGKNADPSIKSIQEQNPSAPVAEEGDKHGL